MQSARKAIRMRREPALTPGAPAESVETEETSMVTACEPESPANDNGTGSYALIATPKPKVASPPVIIRQVPYEKRFPLIEKSLQTDGSRRARVSSAPSTPEPTTPACTSAPASVSNLTFEKQPVFVDQSPKRLFSSASLSPNSKGDLSEIVPEYLLTPVKKRDSEDKNEHRAEYNIDALRRNDRCLTNLRTLDVDQKKTPKKWAAGSWKNPIQFSHGMGKRNINDTQNSKRSKKRKVTTHPATQHSSTVAPTTEALTTESEENAGGESGRSRGVAMNILNNGRFEISAACTGSMKHRVQKLMDLGKVLEMTEMVARHYATEPIVYMPAANMDRGISEYQLEAAIAKVVASENAWWVCDKAIQLHGGMGFMKETDLELMLRDLRISFRIFEGANDVMHLFVALTRAQHAGKHLQQIAKEISSGGLGTLFDKVVKRATGSTGSNFSAVVDPSLANKASQLDACIGQFGKTAEVLLVKHKKGIIESARRTTETKEEKFPSPTESPTEVENIAEKKVNKEPYYAGLSLARYLKAGFLRNRFIARSLQPSGLVNIPYLTSIKAKFNNGLDMRSLEDLFNRNSIGDSTYVKFNCFMGEFSVKSSLISQLKCPCKNLLPPLIDKFAPSIFLLAVANSCCPQCLEREEQEKYLDKTLSYARLEPKTNGNGLSSTSDHLRIQSSIAKSTMETWTEVYVKNQHSAVVACRVTSGYHTIDPPKFALISGESTLIKFYREGKGLDFIDFESVPTEGETRHSTMIFL